VANNLLERCFAPQQVQRPNRFWCGDITTPNGHPADGSRMALPGRVPVGRIKDLFSRRLPGWALQDTIETTLVTAAVICSIALLYDMFNAGGTGEPEVASDR
jgi:transposase InsO family protein